MQRPQGFSIFIHLMKKRLLTISFFITCSVVLTWGQCWELVYDSYEDNFNFSFIRDIHFINDSVGWACGTHRTSGSSDSKFYIKTTDGGASWEDFESPGSSPNNIFFVNEQDGIISASSIFNTYWTDDGGANWEESSFDIA